jgi:hypothetical protein
MIKKIFSCDSCGTIGQISVKNVDLTINDISICPVCATPLLEFEEEDYE